MASDEGHVMTGWRTVTAVAAVLAVLGAVFVPGAGVSAQTPVEPFARDEGAELDLPARTVSEVANQTFITRALWSDGEILWVLHDGLEEWVFAFDMATGEYLADRSFEVPDWSFELPGGQINVSYPRDLWSDGETMYILDRTDASVYAFDLATGSYVPDKLVWWLNVREEPYTGPFTGDAIHVGNIGVTGMWSDGETLWVSDSREQDIFVRVHTRLDDSIYAFDLESGDRRPDADIKTLAAADVRASTALWSDGVTMWVADNYHDKLFAFDLATGTRNTDLEFDTLAAHISDVDGIWSDGETMWVVGGPLVEMARIITSPNHHVYAFGMPRRSHLSSLELSDVTVESFAPTVLAYAAEVDTSVTSTTVTAVSSDPRASVAVSYIGGDSSEGTGSTVPLSAGDNTITVAVSNGGVTQTYTVTVTMPAPASSAEEESAPDDEERSSTSIDEQSPQPPDMTGLSEFAAELSRRLGDASPQLTTPHQQNQPLSALFERPSRNVNGNITVRLAFSEPLRKGTSYRTLKNHAIAISGGTVAKAKRAVKHKNALWDITIVPTGDIVTVALETSRNCEHGSALCDDGDRPLSRAPTLVVTEATTASPVFDISN